MFKRFFMNRSLKTRIMFLYTLFAVALIGAITLYSYHFMVNLLKEKETSILNDSMDYLEKRISDRIESVNEEYINNFDNEEFLNLYLKSTHMKGDLAKQMELEKEFKQFFFDIQVRNGDFIQSIEMIAGNGMIFGDSYSHPLNYDQFMDSAYYTEAMNNKNKILYRNPEPDSKYFAIMRSFYFFMDEDQDSVYPSVGYSSENNEDYSTLIFFLKKNYLRSMMKEEAEKRQTSIMILDQEGNVVVKEGSIDWLPDGEIENIAKRIGESASGNFEEGLDEGRIGVHYKTIKVMDWKVLYVYDMHILYQQAGRIREVAFIMFLIAIPVVFMIASILSGSVVKPIRSLTKAMDEAVDNNLEVRFVTKYNDEVAQLGQRFTILMKRVSGLMREVKLIEEQKRAEEIKALQAQINPHFLYNTLDTVYWLAKMDGNDSIAGLVSNLADLFRLSLNKGEDITTLAREVEHVRKYLEIQRVRLDGKFDYEIHMEDSLGERRIPKLILQPFVENSLLHGFENIDYQGQIIIDIRTEGEDIFIRITDNGIGIEPDMLEALNQGIPSEGEKQGYAIGNVRERIRLYSDERYGVKFDTKTEKGTRVEILFPGDF